MRTILLAIALIGSSGSAVAGVSEESLVSVRAVAANGEVKWGSAVVLGPQRLATTCHVTRRAATIEISHGDRRWIARVQAGSAIHDLCILSVDGLDLPPVRVRASRDLAPGERVVAAGFEHGGAALATAAGTVKGLYPFDDGMVVRTSAPFDFGSSGGGLFDEAGNLVGLLAFKARTGNDLRFALPSEWLDASSKVVARFEAMDAASPELAFWERGTAHGPAFLGAALREARTPAP